MKLPKLNTFGTRSNDLIFSLSKNDSFIERGFCIDETLIFVVHCLSFVLQDSLESKEYFGEYSHSHLMILTEASLFMTAATKNELHLCHKQKTAARFFNADTELYFCLLIEIL